MARRTITLTPTDLELLEKLKEESGGGVSKDNQHPVAAAFGALYQKVQKISQPHPAKQLLTHIALAAEDVADGSNLVERRWEIRHSVVNGAGQPPATPPWLEFTNAARLEEAEKAFTTLETLVSAFPDDQKEVVLPSVEALKVLIDGLKTSPEIGSDEGVCADLEAVEEATDNVRAALRSASAIQDEAEAVASDELAALTREYFTDANGRLRAFDAEDADSHIKAARELIGRTGQDLRGEQHWALAEPDENITSKRDAMQSVLNTIDSASSKDFGEVKPELIGLVEAIKAEVDKLHTDKEIKALQLVNRLRTDLFFAGSLNNHDVLERLGEFESSARALGRFDQGQIMGLIESFEAAIEPEEMVGKQKTMEHIATLKSKVLAVALRTGEDCPDVKEWEESEEQGFQRLNTITREKCDKVLGALSAEMRSVG